MSELRREAMIPYKKPPVVASHVVADAVTGFAVAGWLTTSIITVITLFYVYPAVFALTLCALLLPLPSYLLLVHPGTEPVTKRLITSEWSKDEVKRLPAASAADRENP